MIWVAYAQTGERELFDNLATGATPEQAIAEARRVQIATKANMAVAYCARPERAPLPDLFRRDRWYAGVQERRLKKMYPRWAAARENSKP
jgi:hypothetical protein